MARWLGAGVAVALALAPRPALSQTDEPECRGAGDTAVPPGEEPRLVAFHGMAIVPVDLAEGESLIAGTCGLPGARRDQPSVVSLLGPDGGRVDVSDDGSRSGCPRGSNVQLAAGAPGTYRILVECRPGRCEGTLAYWIAPRNHVPRAPPGVAQPRAVFRDPGPLQLALRRGDRVYVETQQPLARPAGREHRRAPRDVLERQVADPDRGSL